MTIFEKIIFCYGLACAAVTVVYLIDKAVLRVRAWLRSRRQETAFERKNNLEWTDEDIQDAVNAARAKLATERKRGRTYICTFGTDPDKAEEPSKFN